MHPGTTLCRGALRLPLLSACLSLAGCWTPVCDALFGECPGAIQADAGAPSLDAAVDAGVAPDAGPECVPGTWEFETVTPLEKDEWPRAAADFAIDSSGDVVLTYSNGTSRYFARRSRSGWSAPILLGGGFRTPPTGSIVLVSPGIVEAVWGDDLYEGGAIGVGELLPGADWTRTDLDRCPRFGCAHPRLASDASGVSHLTYVRPWPKEDALLHSHLEYAVRSPGGAWSESEIVSDDCAFGVAIALGPDGPHLAYVDAASLELRHATRVDGTWRIETVRKDMCTDITPSLSVDDAGGVHIGYSQLADAPIYLSYAYAHRPPGGAWVLDDVGEKVGMPPAPSVTTRAGQALIALQTDSFVGVSRRTATGWQTERVAPLAEDTFSRDPGPVLRVDARGGLHLVYPDWGAGSLVYARQCPAP